MAPGFGAATTGARRTRVFGSLCVLVFLVNFGRVAFAPLIDPFMDAFGVGEATAGLLATLVWLGSALSRVPTGYLLTRVPRHRVLLADGAFLAAACWFIAAAPGIYAVGAGALLVGLASGVYFIAANPFVSELFPERVGRALGVHGAASQVAAVVAPLGIAAVVVAASWRAVFAAMGGLVVVATAWLYVVARAADLPTAGAADRDMVGAVRRQWPLILTGIAFLATAGFVWNGLFNFYISYLHDVKGVSQATAGTLLTLAFAAGMPAFWYTGRLADRFRHVPLLLAVFAAFTGSVLTLTTVSGVWPLVAVTLVLGYAVHSLFPAIDTYLLDSLPDENRASAYSAYSGGMMVIQATGSVTLGTLVEAGVGYDAALRAAAAGLSVVLVAMATLYATDRLPGAAE